VFCFKLNIADCAALIKVCLVLSSILLCCIDKGVFSFKLIIADYAALIKVCLVLSSLLLTMLH